MANQYGKYTAGEYEYALSLLRCGLSLTAVARRLGIPKSTLYYWWRGRHRPPATHWVPKPGRELAYALGALLGDGTLSRKRNGVYEVTLRVTDYEFAYEFSRALATVLGKPAKQPKWVEGRRWRVTYESKAFHNWYSSLRKSISKGNLSNLRKYVEHNKETVRAFLRGIFDAEGSHTAGRIISLINTNLTLLQYVQHLLAKHFSILSKIRQITPPKEFTIRGRTYKCKKACYALVISRKFFIQKFINEIGFTIIRKQLGLLVRRKRGRSSASPLINKYI